MAAELTSSGYIKHHLQNLTCTFFHNGEWGFQCATSAEQAQSYGFWGFHADTLFWSFILGVVFLFVFNLAGKRALAAGPLAASQLGYGIFARW